MKTPKITLINQELKNIFASIDSQDDVTDPMIIAKFVAPRFKKKWFAISYEEASNTRFGCIAFKKTRILQHGRIGIASFIWLSRRTRPILYAMQIVGIYVVCFATDNQIISKHIPFKNRDMLHLMVMIIAYFKNTGKTLYLFAAGLSNFMRYYFATKKLPI